MVTFLAVVSSLELLAFFAADFVFAKALTALKEDHPVLDDCAPQETPELDAAHILNSLKETASDLYAHQVERLGRDGGYQAVPSPAEAEDGASPVASAPPATPPPGGNAVHTIVVVAGFLAPLFAVLQLLLPGAMRFARIGTPPWLQFVAVVPGLAIVALYVSRTVHVTRFEDVTKSQWLSLMWFRLDLMCILAVLMLVGMGTWLVSLCMLIVVTYLAHRLLLTEKRLHRAQNQTQLFRRHEVDLEHVYAPGTAEAERALGKPAVVGYQSV